MGRGSEREACRTEREREVEGGGRQTGKQTYRETMRQSLCRSYAV